MDRSTTATRKDAILRCAMIIAATLLIGYAASMPFTLLLLALAARMQLPDILALTIAIPLLIGIAVWLKQRRGTALHILETASLIAAGLFLASAACAVGVTFYESLGPQQGSGSNSLALTALLAAFFATIPLAQAAICLTLSLILRRRRAQSGL